MPQQFSELENFGPLGAGVYGEVSWPIDYMYNNTELLKVVILGYRR